MIQTLFTDTAFSAIENGEHRVEIEIAPRALVQGVVRRVARKGVVIRGDFRHVARLETRCTPFNSDTREKLPPPPPGQYSVDAHQRRNGDENDNGGSWWPHAT